MAALGLWKLVAIGLFIMMAVSGLIGTGFYWGVTHASEAAVKDANDRIAKAIKDGIDRADITMKVQSAFTDRLRIIRVKGDTIINEVESHVKDNGCRFDPSFSVLHNRAALNDVPDSAGRVEGTTPKGTSPAASQAGGN